MPIQHTILLINDEPNLLRVNARVLERKGYYVLPVRTLRDARALIGGVNLHAAVLDVELEDGSGLEFCRELREGNGELRMENGELRRIPVIFLTALNGKESEQAGYDAGADDYIVKPYRIERLIEGIGALLGNGNCELELRVGN